MKSWSVVQAKQQPRWFNVLMLRRNCDREMTMLHIATALGRRREDITAISALTDTEAEIVIAYFEKRKEQTA